MTIVGTPNAAPPPAGVDAAGAPGGGPAEQHHRRRTPPSARGEPAVWLTAGALAVSLALIVVMLGVIALRGSSTFWPRPVQRVALEGGGVLLGQPLETERFRPDERLRERIIASAGGEAEARAAGLLDADGLTPRTRFRVGNRDLGQDSTRWVPNADIASIEPADDAVVVERLSRGVFIGSFERLEVRGPGAPDEALTVEGAARFDARLAEARAVRAELRDLLDRRIPRVETALASLRWEVEAAEDAFARAEAVREGRAGGPWPLWAWALALATAAAGAVAWSIAGRRGEDGRPSGAGRAARPFLVVVTLAAALAAALEHPWSGPTMTADRLERVRERVEAERRDLQAERAQLNVTLRDLRDRADAVRVVYRDPATGRIAPESAGQPTVPMRLTEVVRATRVTGLGPGERVALWLARWKTFLGERPGEAAGDGGVFPVIVGTVTLTLLLTVGVVPLGVIAAVYLREYARQGPLTSAIRVAINNLAGVPSIVYGMFGLGFFCYAVGGWIDAGPETPAPRAAWWPTLAAFGLLIALALTAGAAARGRREDRDWLSRGARLGVGLLWVAAIVLAARLVSTTPYFGGFFAERLPEQPTFGGRGILWASLTLALLTLPVVVVATEEAIAAVPKSMREGSLGCGASRWQTIRRIVLPAAMPGIMTGAILAMARGAGEVAPLMLVGAVNLTKDLPVSADWPFLHGERTFMHLGFHIFNLGFQSADSDATQPLVWTTALLLVAIVLVLNLVAVVIRARLRRAGSVV